MRPATLRLLGIPALVLLAAATARAGVVVVDPAGGSGGALLQAAIDGAQGGDILLLRAGDYTDADITWSGKALALVADPPGAQVTLSRLTIILPQDLDQTCLLRGLDIQPPPVVTAGLGAGITLQGPLGISAAAWLEDCTATSSRLDVDGPGGLPTSAHAGIACLLAAEVVLVRCSATGADGADAAPGDSASAGGNGIETFLSSIAVHEGTFTGGAGGDGLGDGFLGTDGGDGIYQVGLASILGATLRGGDEGADNPATTKPGAGLRLAGGKGSVRDVDVLPGSVVGAGTPSEPIVLDPGSVLTTFPAAARTLVVPSPLREGQAGSLSLRGESGDGAWVWVGLSAVMKQIAPKQGAFVLGSALPFPIFVGTITDPSGALDFAFQMPDLPPGMDGTPVFLQCSMITAAAELVTGDGSALVWLDGSL